LIVTYPHLFVSFCFIIIDSCILFQNDSQNVPETNIERENGSLSSQDECPVATGPLSVAFDFVTRLASELFGRGKRHLDGSNSDAMDEVENHQSNEVSEPGDDTEKSDENHLTTSDHAAVTTDESSAGKSVDVDMADNPADSEGFKHFDILQCPPDHHYLENTAQVNSMKLCSLFECIIVLSCTFKFYHQIALFCILRLNIF
jgi:ubiquitin-conjugating enzyme E2 O